MDYYPLRTDVKFNAATGYGKDGEPRIFAVGGSAPGTIPVFNDSGYIHSNIIPEDEYYQFRHEDSAYYLASRGLVRQVLDNLVSPSLFGISSHIKLDVNQSLSLAPHRLYIVQCYDDSNNTTSMTLKGGTKDGIECNLAFAITGNENDQFGNKEALVLYITGSLIISNLAGTASGVESIAPKDGCFIKYFEMGKGVDFSLLW